MGTARTRRGRGQALVEMALAVPILLYLLLGGADLGRAFYFSVEMAGASRVGMRAGALNIGTDLGATLRSEPNSAIPNNTATWGDTGPGGLNADCSSASQKCGDPSGCATSVFTGTRAACFAVRTCTMSGGNCAAPFGTWQSRPGASSELGLDVIAVYKFIPVTPFVSQLAGAAGAFFLRSETFGLELY